MDLQTFMLLIGSVLGIFTIIIVITRIFGLRTFAKMSSFDFASTIAVGSVLASIVLNKNQTLAEGGVILFAIIGFQTLFSFLVRKITWFKSIFTNDPYLLMWKGEIYYDNLQRCNIGESDLLAKLREANVHKLSEVQAVILESTGDVSVLHSADDVEIEAKILEGVRK